MDTNRHTIKKQIMDINIGPTLNPFTVQEDISNLCHTKIPEALDEVFNDFETSQHLIIEKLEVEIGTIHIDDLATALPQKVREKLYDALSNSLISPGKQDNNIKTVTETASDLELLTHFLHRGTIPWWASKFTGASLEGILANLLKTAKSEIKSLFIEGIKSANFRQRLASQFSSGIILSIIDILDHHYGKTVKALFRDSKFKAELAPTMDKEAYLWSLILSRLANNGSNVAAKELASSLQQKLEAQDLQDMGKSKNHKKMKEAELLPPTKFEMLKFFLKTGVLSADPDKNTLEKLFKNQLANEETENFLKKEIKSEKFRERLAYHFPPEIILLVVKAIAPRQYAIISETLTEIMTLLKTRTGWINHPVMEAFLSLQILDFLVHPQFSKKRLFYHLLKSLNEKWPGALMKRKKRKKTELTDGNKLAIITHFMNTGSLPWWASSMNIKILPGVFKGILKKPSKDTLEFLKHGIRYPWFRKRLLNQFPEKIVYSVINAIIPVQNNGILPMMKELNKIFKSYRTGLWPTMINASFIQSHFLSWYKAIDPLDVKIWIKNLLHEISTGSQLSYQETVEWLQVKAVNLSADLSIILHGMETQSITIDPDPQQPKNPEIDELYIENAGMVILWVYLDKFFKHLKLTENQQFIDKSSAHRAVHLLQYLVMGKQEQAEYHFPLNKILCGLEIEDPVPRNLKLKKKEISACEELLTEVVQNWATLKNTSIKGLREAFLKREGKLIRNNNGWRLIVEQKAYDILMGKLPWSISIVKLPWMSGAIHVEW